MHPHLAALAREPRPAGSDAEERARVYAVRELERLGFSVAIERFTYSQLPGRYGTPIGGVGTAGLVLLTAAIARTTGDCRIALINLAVGGGIMAMYARFMLGHRALALPWMRAGSSNVTATRGTSPPSVWLMAHLDSKSQPMPSLVRITGVGLLLLSLGMTVFAIAWQLAGRDAGATWAIATAVALLGGVPVGLSVVGDRSAGAVDNASGVSAVLDAAARVTPSARVGVVLTSAEELGLAGAREWAATRAAGVALNCDGVDDEGELTIMYSGRRPQRLLDVIGTATSAVRVRRMPLGLLTDSAALAGSGWAAVTVSRGSFATLKRVHTPGDDLAATTGRGIPEVATLLARAAEALAR